MKKKFTMKHILIPVGVVILILAIVAIILSKTGAGTNPGYHVHEDGSTHYDSEVVETTYHVHDDGETHFEEH